MSESATGGWRGRVTDENTVVATGVLVALPAVVLLDRFFGGSIGVVFLVTLAAGTVPAIAYSSHWPREYTPAKAAFWGVGAALIVLGVMTGLTLAFASVVGVDGGVVVAFVLVVLAQRYGPRLLN